MLPHDGAVKVVNYPSHLVGVGLSLEIERDRTTIGAGNLDFLLGLE